jgi:TolA-binding protein
VGKRELEQLRKAFDLFVKDVDIRLNARNSLPKDPDQLFQHGQKKLADGESKAALKAFERFLQNFPKDDRADNALFHVGEAHLKESRFRDAASVFRRVLRDYDSSEVKDAATLRFGDALVGMNRCDDARVFYKEVTTKFRRSPFRKEAGQKVRLIDRKQLCN